MQYFEVQISYLKMQDNGEQKRVKESYLVDAMTFTEAEARITEYAKAFQELNVEAEKRTPFGEVLNLGYATKFYTVKVDVITVDENSGVEKKHPVLYCIQAFSIDNADELMRKELDKTMLDCEIAKVAETKIVDVINHG